MALTIILIGLCIFMAIFAIGAFCIAAGERKARTQKEKYIKEVQENERKAVEIMAEANETKAEVRTGDHSNDFKHMADKLHEYAKK